MNQPLVREDAIAKGQDWVIEFRVLSAEGVELAADAVTGATSLAVKVLEDSFLTGDMLLFGKNTVITLSGPAAAGATTVAVTAIPGPLGSGQRGRKIRDLTGFTMEFEVLEGFGDATPVIATGAVSITPATQTGTDRGKVQVAGLAATTTSLAPKRYAYALWRTNAGSKRPLAFGDFDISERGFL